MEISIPYNFKPRDYQLKFFQFMDTGTSANKRALLRWHRRAGKDKASWCYMIKEAFTVPGNYFYIFPEAAQARKALWKNIDSKGFAAIDHIPKEVKGVRINNQEMFIEIPTMCGSKSTIQVVGLDKDPHKIRGVACKGAVFSEFAYQDPTGYHVLLPAIRETKGWIIINSTPQGKNHMWDLERSAKDSPNWYIDVRQTVWPEDEGYTGLLSHQALLDAQIEEQSDWEDIEREYGASYASGTSGAIFTRQLKECRSEGRIGPYSYNNNYPVYAFVDLGHDDPTAIWFVQYIGHAIHFIDYFEEKQLEMTDIAKVLIRKNYPIFTVWLPHDANQHHQLLYTKFELLVNTLKSLGSDTIVRTYPGKGNIKLSVQERINACKLRFSRYFFNSATCGEALDILALYHKKYDTKNKVYSKEPVHDWTSHCADAIGLEACIAEEDFSVNNTATYAVKIMENYDPFY